MKSMVCIYCHFNQPPREDPRLEDVEMQDSAYPFHDWNERITDECYRSNAVSRILVYNHMILPLTNDRSLQNLFFDIMQWAYKPMLERTEAGDRQAIDWVAAFTQIADNLKITVPQLEQQI